MELFKKLFYTGVGLVSTTTEKLQAQIDELVNKGKISKEEGRKVVDELIDSTESKKEEFEAKIKEIVTNALAAINLPSASELKELVARIEKLEANSKTTVKKTTKRVTTKAKKATTTAKTTTAKAKATATKTVKKAVAAKEAVVDALKK